jgi:hypothetical protein
MVSCRWKNQSDSRFRKRTPSAASICSRFRSSTRLEPSAIASESVVLDLVRSCPDGLLWLEWVQGVLLQTACVKVYLCLQGTAAGMTTTPEGSGQEKQATNEEGAKLSWEKETELLIHPVLLYHCCESSSQSKHC